MPAPRVYNKHHKDVPDDAVYIGRGCPWGNRFVIGEHGDRDQVCNRFDCEQLPEMDVSSLAGQDLVCFCAPHRCHGDSILLKVNFRVVVFGGRNFADSRQDGPGMAEERGVSVDPYPAAWDDITRPGAVVRKNRYGKPYDVLAGHVRNEKMLRVGRPQLAIGFPGGIGTKDMTVRCLEYGLVPYLPRPD
ncbi:DUF4326 domain-containing protein [Bradyrhizobium oligotrophicum S58]